MEMLIVVTIIGILAAIVIPRIVSSSGTAKKAAHTQERLTINAQIEEFFFLYNQYPSAMTTEGWLAPDGSRNAASFFPDGVPVTCNQGVIWTISNGRLEREGHSNHE